MGAVPSRESHARGLCQLPEYGQRHRMLLIPLTKAFFPSADCLLLQQLFEARCDPFVRYYHAYEEYFAPNADIHPTTDRPTPPSSESEPHTWRPDAFPPVPCTPEAFYDTYVARGGESLLFDTDAEMLAAFARNPCLVRPVPCAVAFAYNHPAGSARRRSHSEDAPSQSHLPAATDPSGEGIGKSHTSHAAVMTPTTGEASAVTPRTVCPIGDGGTFAPTDTAEVCGWRVQAVGFFGDVAALRRGAVPETDDIHLQMFIKKCVGDHNCMHILLAGVYTYAAQWHQAVCVAKGESIPNRNDTRRKKKDASEGDKEDRNDTKEDENDEDDGSPWVPPPIRTVCMSNRRADVPLLCFLRGVRAILVGMNLASTEDAEVSQHEVDDNDNSGSNVGNNTQASNMTPTTAIPLFKETELMTMSFKENTEGHKGAELVYASASADVVSRAAHYIVDCIRRRKHPLDILRERPQPNHTQTPPSIPADGASKSGRGVGTAGIAFPLLPDVSALVEAWPAEGVDLAAAATRREETDLYWVIGTGAAAQRSAAAAVASWPQRGPPLEAEESNGAAENGRNGATPAMEAGRVGKPFAQIGVGGVLHFVAQSALDTPRVLRCEHYPLEELLLAELRNACKRAREADAQSPNWVRSAAETARATDEHQTKSETEDTDEKERVKPNEGEAEVGAGLVSDGLSYLWRVPLGDGEERIIAVTAQFGRPDRRKRKIRWRPHSDHNRLPAVCSPTAPTPAHAAAGAGGSQRSPEHTRTHHPTHQPATNTTAAVSTSHATPSTKPKSSAPPTGEEGDGKRKAKRPPSANTIPADAPFPTSRSHPNLNTPTAAPNATRPPVMYHSRTVSEGTRVSFRDSLHEADGCVFSAYLPGALSAGCGVGPNRPPRPAAPPTPFTPNDGVPHRRCYSQGSFASTGTPSSSLHWPPEERLAPPPQYPPHSHSSHSNNSHGGHWWGPAPAEMEAVGAHFLSPSASVTPLQESQPGRGGSPTENNFTGIHVTVRHGLPHYRTPSSLNYSETASSHDAGANASATSAKNASKHLSGPSGAYRWDWRRNSGQQEEWEGIEP